MEAHMAGKTAIIIGGGAKARNLDVAMCDAEGVEIWGINAIRKKWVPRWDRMFNLHRYDLLRKYGWPVEVDAEWCANHEDIPFYTVDQWPDGRMARTIIFPREKMAEAMPRGDYHCNSFDWLVAYAVYRGGYDSVHLHGVTLTTDGLLEQMSSRACLEYWCGYAEAKGVKIVQSKDCNLFYATHLVLSERVYGYDDCPAYEDRTSNAPPGGQPPYRFDE
jgi:hypothetical protein